MALKVTGIKVVDQALASLEKRVAKKVLQQSMRRAMKPVAQAVKENAPVGESGDLKDSIKVRSLKRSRVRQGIVVLISETTIKSERFYEAFTELGTSKTPANPFMRNAFDEKGESAKEDAINLILQGVDKVVKESA
jgi:HK97 gp10 family phage protein